MKILSILALFSLSIATLIGCGSKPPSRSEFSGEVITEVPEVPGANQQYLLPELDEGVTEEPESK